MKRNALHEIVNPGPMMRPAPFWSWNDKLDETELRRQIREMAEKGWGSYFMHSRVGLVTGYLSDEWMNLVRACADEAEKTGTLAWLYDEDKWPSGFAGGLVPEKDEAYRARNLVLLEKDCATENDTVLASVNHGGREYDICKRVQPLGQVWFNGASYVDLMSPDAVREFINVTHEAYKKACGEYFGKSIPGVFTDEPCYSYNNPLEVIRVPWSEFLPGLFKEMKGYEITDHLPKLFFPIDDYRKIRFDFYDVASELLKRSFTKQYYDWCEENGLIMTGHFMAEDTLWFQTMWSGDVMSNYEFMHWPGIDKLGRNVTVADRYGADQTVTVKQCSSVVDQLGKDRAFSEVYGCIGGWASFFHRKWIGDWQAALGINFVNHHLSLYSMRGERKRDYPANFFYQQPWWEEERGMADYQARLCAALSQGERLVDVLLIQPLSSVWSEYSPLNLENDHAPERVYDVPFARLSRRLMEEKLDHHYGNESLMAKHGTVVGGLVKVGGHTYGCVIVPPSLNMKSSTLELLRKFAAGGGDLIVAGSMPALVDGAPGDTGIPNATVVTTIEEAVSLARTLMPERIGVLDRLTGRNAPTVYIHSRVLGGSSRHFLANIDEKRPVHATVRLPKYKHRSVAVLDLYDGSLYRVDARGGRFDVTLAPAGSLLVICGREAKTTEASPPSVLGSGAAFVDLAKTAPSLVIENFDCEVLEENVMLLNDFALELKGKEVYRGPICGAWHNHFYSAPEGTPFRAGYTFLSETEMDGCFAVLELAENLKSITFNGVPVSPGKSPGESGAFDPEKSWKDVNFTRVPLPRLAKGENTLVIEGKKVNNITGPGFHRRVPDWQKHQATEAEEAYVCGNFTVKRLSDGLFAVAAPAKPTGRNITREGFPFYCGRMALRADFDAKREGRTLLKLNGAEMAGARIRVNGVECGVLRWEPFVVDITDAVKAGRNSVEIEMATTLVNAFGPNRRAGVKEEVGNSPRSFVEMHRFKDTYELFDFGLESVGIYTL